MKEIERYIQFAIDNGYFHNQMVTLQCLWKRWDLRDRDKTDIFLVYWLIQQKEFIEAIARGLYETTDYRNTQSEWRVDYHKLLEDQAHAISENELEAFITKLLWTENK